ncbi:kinase-like domain-containing protein [Xylariaceae sp. FL0594]|nr:kinase-like domain-containing protein [Xylariaceae sp. FL0594]
MRGAAFPPKLTALQPLATASRKSLSQPRQVLNKAIHQSSARKATTVEHSYVLPPELIEPGVILRGYSGKEYTIQNVLQDRQNRQVYLARADEKMFVLKSLFEKDYKYSLPLQLRFKQSPYLRALRDTVPEQNMFVNEYLTDHLLNFAFKDVSLATQKRILRDTLRGLATLHAQNIAHLDVKANNIMIDYRETDEGIVVDRVQLSDLEDSTLIPPGQALSGLQIGNQLWRSPEAHVQGAVGKPSDIFSLAIVFIFLRLRNVIFLVDSERTVDPTSDILTRQISYFANWDDFDGFLNYLGRSHPWASNLRRMADTFGEGNPRRPFSLWKSNLLDADFKDLIGKMTNFDPRKRITAEEALEHPWFADVADE